MFLILAYCVVHLRVNGLFFGQLVGLTDISVTIPSQQYYLSGGDTKV